MVQQKAPFLREGLGDPMKLNLVPLGSPDSIAEMYVSTRQELDSPSLC